MTRERGKRRSRGRRSRVANTSPAFGLRGAWLTIVGILVSGPVGLGIVYAVYPIGPWSGPAEFAAGFHPVHTLPYWGGILLVLGYVIVLSAIYGSAGARVKARLMAASISTALFATFILFNYVVQTSYLPTLARNYEPANAGIVSALSMANPTSLVWAIEMWGYAFLGAATWLASVVFDNGSFERRLAMLMRLNGVVSIIGGVVTAANPDWVLKTPGLVAYGLWNLLALTISVLMVVVFRRRSRVPVINTQRVKV